MLYPATAELLGFQDNATECAELAMPVPDIAMTMAEFLALLLTLMLPVAVPME